MRRLVMVFAAMAVMAMMMSVMAVPAFAIVPGGGKASEPLHNNPLQAKDTQGTERGTWNSAGGDRSPSDGDGVNFGREAAPYVQEHSPYGLEELIANHWVPGVGPQK